MFKFTLFTLNICSLFKKKKCIKHKTYLGKRSNFGEYSEVFRGFYFYFSPNM